MILLLISISIILADVIGDFGLARVLSDGSLFAHTYVGTPFYMSPVSKMDQLESHQSIKSSTFMRDNNNLYSIYIYPWD